MAQSLVTLIPAIEPDELAYLQEITKDLSEEKLRVFISIYNGRRKKADVILICTLLGFVFCAGIQRFLLGQIGMGILYLFTAGLCFIGTIVDVINHKQLAFEHNQKMALESMALAKGY
jgi:TM2 domain-containing membrane protein YozV